MLARAGQMSVAGGAVRCALESCSRAGTARPRYGAPGMDAPLLIGPGYEQGRGRGAIHRT